MTKNKKETTTSILPVAIDDGYAQTKLVGQCPETGELKKVILRSAAKEGDVGLGSFTGGGKDQYRTEEGRTFTVSSAIESEDTQFDSFHTSELNRVLVNHALLKAGYSGQQINLMTGLPVSDYFLGNERDDEQIDAKRQNLLKSLTTSDGSPTPYLADVNVGCQAVAAWFDYIFDINLKVRNETKGQVAIVDIGGRTTDVAVVVDGESINHSKSGTENLGVPDVYASIQKAIRKEYRVKDQYPLDDFDSAVRTGKFKLWNQEQDVSELVEEVVGEHESKIARAVERKLGRASNLNAVVFVGGGSALFTTIASRFPNGQFADDPEFANAMGLYKIIKRKG